MKRILSIVLVMLLMMSAAYADAEYELVANLGSAEAAEYVTVAEIDVPEGYVYVEGVTPNSVYEPEYYFIPEVPENGVRFMYFTTGFGDYRRLAKLAAESYAGFYEVYEAGEIVEGEYAGKESLTFTYTCSYAGPDGVTPVYEQSALCYFPIKNNGFIACIISFGFGSESEYLDAATIDTYIEQAAAAIQMTI